MATPDLPDPMETPERLEAVVDTHSQVRPDPREMLDRTAVLDSPEHLALLAPVAHR